MTHQNQQAIALLLRMQVLLKEMQELTKKKADAARFSLRKTQF